MSKQKSEKRAERAAQEARERAILAKAGSVETRPARSSAAGT
jgi:hypothetical protein